MALKELTLDAIGDLDEGAVRLIVNAALASAVHDLDDRGSDGKAREVTITLKMARMDEGQSDNVAIHVEAGAKLPKYRAPGTIAKIKARDGQSTLAFQDGDAGDPDQRTIDEVIEEERE